MSMSHKQLEASLAADARLTSMGVLCPLPQESPDAPSWDELIKGSAERASAARAKILAQYGTLSLSVYARKTPWEYSAARRNKS